MFEHENKLFEVAVRPLADNVEMQLAAVGLLERSADNSQATTDAAIARWEAADAARPRPVWKWSFIAVLIGLSAWAWTVAAREALAYWRLQEVSVIHRYDNDPDYPAAVKMLDQCLPGKLTQHERWLFLGNPSESTRVGAMKALWDSARDEPAFHMEYVFSEYENRHKGAVPVDFLDTAQRLDPGNSWPYYAAGAFKMRKAIKEVQLGPAERAAKVPYRWEILDQGKLDECIALFHEASLQPEFDTYQGRLVKMRKELFPVEDHLGYLTASKIFWLEHWGNQSPCAYLSALPVAAAAKSQQLAMTGDKEGFVRLMSDLELLNRRWVEGEIQGAAAESAFSGSLWTAIPRLRASAVSLGLPREAARLDEILKAMNMLRQKGSEEEDSRPDGFHDWFENHSSTLLSEFRRFYSAMWYPKWSVEELKPGRMADHELLSRGCSLAVWLIFGLGLLGLALYRFRLPRLIRRLAARISELLDARDHAWIIGAGVLVPYAFTMVINQLTPLGGRDWSIVGNHLMLPIGQFFGMTVLMLLVPILVARWRLERKAAVLGIMGEKSAWGPPCGGLRCCLDSGLRLVCAARAGVGVVCPARPAGVFPDRVPGALVGGKFVQSRVRIWRTAVVAPGDHFTSLHSSVCHGHVADGDGSSSPQGGGTRVVPPRYDDDLGPGIPRGEPLRLPGGGGDPPARPGSSRDGPLNQSREMSLGSMWNVCQ